MSDGFKFHLSVSSFFSTLAQLNKYFVIFDEAEFWKIIVISYNHNFGSGLLFIS